VCIWVNTASVDTNSWQCWPAVLSIQIENMRIWVSISNVMVKNCPLGPSWTGTAHTEHKMRMVGDNVDSDDDSDIENYNAKDGDREESHWSFSQQRFCLNPSRQWKWKWTWSTKQMKQDRQCIYNITLRNVCATMVAVKSNNLFWVCFSGLSYPTCTILSSVACLAAP
jgi:hypothetical protein